VKKANRYYRFGPFRLVPDERALFRNATPVALTPKAFNILVLLVENHGHLVRTDEIIRKVWPDTHGGNLPVQMTAIRNALQADYIESKQKYGYRFREPVTEGQEDSGHSVPSSTLWRLGALGSAMVGMVCIIGLLLYLALHSKSEAIRRPSPQAGLYQRALEYERAGDDDQALTTLDQAIQLDPNYDEACVRAAYLAYEAEEGPKAASYLKNCKASQGQDEALRLKAQALEQVLADNGTRAMQLYQLLIDRYPRDTDALFRFAEVATDRDRLDEADKVSSRCIALEPNNPYCRFQLMYVRLKQNKFADVLNDSKSLPASVRDYPWFDEPVGVALLGTGQLDLAKETFERLAGHQQHLHGTSHFTTGKEWVADVLLYQGRVSEATRRIQQMMDTGENALARAGYLAYLARIYMLLGDTKVARSFAMETLTAPAEPDSLSVAAVVLANTGDSVAVEKVLKARSGMTTATLSPANEHLIRGLLAASKGDDTKAIEEIQLTRDLNSHDEEATYWLGMAYMRSRDFKFALATFQNLRDLKGTILLDDVPFLVPLATYRIAQCYEALGEPSAAAAYYAEAAKVWAGADTSLPPKSVPVRLGSK